jgi:hypothetical protein
MTTISDKDLILCNQQGFIPGPEEIEEAYLKRVAYCLNLKENMLQAGCDVPPEMQPIPKELVSEFSKITGPLFDIFPDWIPIVFSNQQLAPWHGGCAWIFQFTEETPMGAFFQVRRAFAKQERYLGIYRLTELLAHETAHVGRMLFEEPRFEEILAYRTSPSTFRRWFGPIVQSPWESILFLFLLLISVVTQFFLVYSDVPRETSLGLWSMLLPLGWLTLGLIRLGRRHSQFNRCLDGLKIIAGDEKKANALIFRLLDSEITAFSKMSLDEMHHYADFQKSLRWRLINLIYRNKSN